MKHIFHPRHGFYCSFTPALFCHCAEKGTKQAWFYFRPLFSFRNLQAPAYAMKARYNGDGVYRGGGREKIHIDTPRAGAAEGEEDEEGRGGCIFSENIARTSSRRRSPARRMEKQYFAVSPRVFHTRSLSPSSLLPFFPFPFLSFSLSSFFLFIIA